MWSDTFPKFRDEKIVGVHILENKWQDIGVRDDDKCGVERVLLKCDFCEDVVETNNVSFTNPYATFYYKFFFEFDEGDLIVGFYQNDLGICCGSKDCEILKGLVE